MVYKSPHPGELSRNNDANSNTGHRNKTDILKL